MLELKLVKVDIYLLFKRKENIEQTVFFNNRYSAFLISIFEATMISHLKAGVNLALSNSVIYDQSQVVNRIINNTFPQDH